MQLPKLGDVIQKLELDPGLGDHFVETLNAEHEFEGGDVDNEQGRPVKQRNHLANTPNFSAIGLILAMYFSGSLNSSAAGRKTGHSGGKVKWTHPTFPRTTAC